MHLLNFRTIHTATPYSYQNRSRRVAYHRLSWSFSRWLLKIAWVEVFYIVPTYIVDTKNTSFYSPFVLAKYPHLVYWTTSNHAHIIHLYLKLPPLFGPDGVYLCPRQALNHTLKIMNTCTQWSLWSRLWHLVNGALCLWIDGIMPIFKSYIQLQEEFAMTSKIPIESH